jgi:ribonuclease HI
MNENMHLFCDGGVIQINPSTIGGTWAYYAVLGTKVLGHNCGVLTPKQCGLLAVSNNVTELLAVVRGLESMPSDFAGTVYSDSQVTLGRVFGSYAFKGIPGWVYDILQHQKARFTNWSSIKYTLLKGHPTAAELKEGTTSTGRPVSVYQKMCDDDCRHMGEHFRKLVMVPVVLQHMSDVMSKE